MATTTTRSTLDIKFHVQDGTVTGDSYIWKFNYPKDGAESTLTLQDVKNAIGFGAETGGTTYDFATFCTNYNCKLLTKEGNVIDGIDGASIVVTTVTKNELS